MTGDTLQGFFFRFCGIFTLGKIQCLPYVVFVLFIYNTSKHSSIKKLYFVQMSILHKQFLYQEFILYCEEEAKQSSFFLITGTGTYMFNNLSILKIT